MGVPRNRGCNDGMCRIGGFTLNYFKVAAVFSNEMVLQREKNIRIFGDGKDGFTVSVEFNGCKEQAIISQGRWMIVFPPMKAATDLTMKITCEEQSIEFNDIAIGEVWLAGGQSNMEYELQNCIDGSEFLKTGYDSNVRFYYTQKYSEMNDEFYAAEERSGWNRFDEEKARCWSAVGYLYGKQLAKELGVTVGIIGCNWGGTSASAWMDIQSLIVDSDLNTYVEEYKKAIEGKSKEQQIAEYRQYKEYEAVWEAKKTELYAKKPDITWEEVLEIAGECKWPGPMCYIHPFRPGGLYQTMISRVSPYTLRGFLYYQGESDDHKPEMYDKLLSRLIQQWREDWGDLELPFLFVQLPMHRYAADPDYKHWCKIREAQMQVYQTVKNTGIAVCLDCGEFNEIHPRDKAPVAHRLALLALSEVYKRLDIEKAYGPRYAYMVKKKDSIELHFYHAKDGFILKKEDGMFSLEGNPTGFEIAGSDRIFVTADAVIQEDIILVSSKAVKEPEYVRYYWTNYGPVSVYGKNQIPLAPFRTSKKDEVNDWKENVNQNFIHQEVEV